MKQNGAGFMCMHCCARSAKPVALCCGHLFCRECANLADTFTHVCPLCRSTFARADFGPSGEPPQPQKSACGMKMKDLWQSYLRLLSEKISSPSAVIIASQPAYSAVLANKALAINGDPQGRRATKSTSEYDVFTKLCGRPLLLDAPQFGCVADGMICSGNDRWSSFYQDGGSLVVDLDSQKHAPETHAYLPFYHAAKTIAGLERTVAAVNAGLEARISRLNASKYVATFAGKVLLRSFKCMDAALFRDRQLVTWDNFQAMRSVIPREDRRQLGILIYKTSGCCYVCFRDRKVGVYKIGLEGQHELEYAHCVYEDGLCCDYRRFAVPVLQYTGKSLLPVQIVYAENNYIAKCYDKQTGLIRGGSAEDQFLLVANHDALRRKFQASVDCIRIKCNVGCQVFALHDDFVTSDYVKHGAVVAASINYGGQAARQLGRLAGVLRDHALVQWNTADGVQCELVNVATPFSSELVYF